MIFRKLHHICIVVEDIEKAEEYYTRMGIGPWYDYPRGDSYVEFDVPYAEGVNALRYRCVDLENFQIQLCQPGLEVSEKRKFLDGRGEGVFHLGFEVADLDAAEAQARKAGLGITSRGRRADGTGFCYFDTQEDAGVVLEVRRSSDED